MHLGPMRVVELVDREARGERVLEAHVVDALVHRLLDQERGHRGQCSDSSCELERTVGELVVGEDLADHPEPVRLVDVDRVAREHELLGLARPELPRVCEVLEAAHAEPGAHDVGKAGVLRRDDQVARPHEHEPGRVDGAVHLGDRDLAQVAPALRVLVEVVPLLEHPVLRAFAGSAIGHRRDVGVLAVHLLALLLGAHVVAGREEWARAAEDHDADLVVGLGLEERVVEVDEELPALRVATLRAVQHDPSDRAFVQRLVRDVLVVPHELFSSI